ncbi:uncharacterized protein Ecym_4022 [Eremothecium cymbalariae DBVPG|uniref:Uncharacterized protein n=1 Tax=Eremothecium cymbalariae (strain CBS 270.75 / DBVPG 7215 / KCTC 17166 / NRRL Y-17582) TaxID=931890 RepID=G8JSV2_ERECY|nr:hypothetical protein Ecym_4022 [Eremothecium cymbalariae DBVPG\
MQPATSASQDNNKSQEKDNWIVKGYAWNPQCVIA